jgi:hypothetical protein
MKPIIDWNQLRKRKLLLASPFYGNSLLYGYHKSVLDLTISCMRSGIAMGHKYVGSDSLVPRARNRLVAHLLDSDATDILMVDSDISFTTEDAMSLMASNQPIVGGVYPRKQLDWNRIAAAAKAGIPAEQLPHYGFIPVMNWAAAGDYSLDDLIEVRHLGTGFLLIKKEVFIQMIATLGDAIAYDHSSDEEIFKGRVGYDFFPIGVDPRYPLGSGGRQYWSEDYGFCELARQCGFKLYAAPWIQLTHSGTMDYTGNLEVMDNALEDFLLESK